MPSPPSHFYIFFLVFNDFNLNLSFFLTESLTDEYHLRNSHSLRFVLIDRPTGGGGGGGGGKSYNLRFEKIKKNLLGRFGKQIWRSFNHSTPAQRPFITINGLGSGHGGCGGGGGGGCGDANINVFLFLSLTQSHHGW